jgi:tryptophanyl-tRNA synthetase
MLGKTMSILVSGIQTSGSLHLGNYLGSIKNWVNIHKQYDSYLFLADLHSITVPQDPSFIRSCAYEVAAAYIASGISSDKATIFVQSSVPAHTELSWILSCVTSMGWLNRMTQFKDKAGKDKEKASLGLYSYPVLQAADVLLYKADIVPVGEDQKQHIELCRDIAAAFNRNVNKDYFNLPEPMIMKEGARIMSLRDGAQKMSKSDPSDNSRINLLDDQDTIYQKIKKSKTDSISEIYYDKENRPEVSNLFSIYAALSDRKIETIIDEFTGKTFSEFKSKLADLTVEVIGPISKEMRRILNSKDYLDNILSFGAEKANKIASQNIKEVKELVGFISL